MHRFVKPKSPRPVQARARELRHPLTPAEELLWHRLRDRRSDRKFRRQCPIGPFVVDFYCHEARLVVEVDGDVRTIEGQVARNQDRTEWLEERGYQIVRFKNEEVQRDPDSVIEEIVSATTLRPSPRPSAGERGRG